MLNTAHAGRTGRPVVATFVRLARHRAHQKTRWQTYATEAALPEEPQNTSDTLSSG